MSYKEIMDFLFADEKNENEEKLWQNSFYLKLK